MESPPLLLLESSHIPTQYHGTTYNTAFFQCLSKDFCPDAQGLSDELTQE